MEEQFNRLLCMFAQVSRSTFQKIADKEKYKGYYTYIPFWNYKGLKDQLNKLKFKSFIDLGCGVPLIPYFVKTHFPNVKCAGVEVREEIVTTCGAYFTPEVSLFCADIFSLKKEFLNQYDCLYMYVPMHDYQLMKKFMDSLTNKLKKGQIVVCCGTGFEGASRKKYRKMSQTGEFHIYQKL